MAEKTDKPTSVKISPGTGIPDVELTFKEATGADYLALGENKRTDEEYTFALCVLLVLVDGVTQTAEWWKKVPMKSLHVAINFAHENVPKFSDSIKESKDPLE